MRNAIKILALLAMGLGAGWAMGQTSSGTATVTVVSPPKPKATVTVTPATSIAPLGSTLTLQLAATGSAGTPDGKLELLVTAPGATAKSLVNTYPLGDGTVSCSYPIPSTAPLGTYSVEAALCGSTKYANSPDCQ